MSCGGGYSRLSSKNNKLNRYNFIKNSKEGAILIEFAFAVPILFSLIYYIQDLHHLKQMQDRMKFVATEIASILQNISQNRVNKTITLTDIKHAACAAYLSFFPGKTLYNSAFRTSPLGYSVSGHIYCVKGLDDGTASVLWCKRWHSAIETYAPASLTIQEKDRFRTLVNLGTNVAPSAIYKDLKIEKNEIKIIIEAASHCADNLKLPDGKTVAQSGGRAKVYGFYIYPFKGTFPDADGGSINFSSVVIFTPKPGLFSEVEPK